MKDRNGAPFTALLEVFPSFSHDSSTDRGLVNSTIIKINCIKRNCFLFFFKSSLCSLVFLKFVKKGIVVEDYTIKTITILKTYNSLDQRMKYPPIHSL